MTRANQEINIRSNFTISVFLSSGILMLIFNINVHTPHMRKLSGLYLQNCCWILVLTANIKSYFRVLSPSFWILWIHLRCTLLSAFFVLLPKWKFLSVFILLWAKITSPALQQLPLLFHSTQSSVCCLESFWLITKAHTVLH